MEVNSYFTDFLAAIRPTTDQIEKMKSKHEELRERLKNDPILGPLIISTFIQGSYRRYTANRPLAGKQCDVDIIVVTKMHEDDYSAEQALEKFRPFLIEHYGGLYSKQGRSWGINVDAEVSLDLVPTSAPSEAEKEAFENSKLFKWNFLNEPAVSNSLSYNSLILEGSGYQFEKFKSAAAQPQWKQDPLRIPDREASVWVDTHPLAQILWTWEKSKSTNGHYVNVVKSLKRWRQVKQKTPKYPKSYPLEHLIGDCCPDGIENVATGVTLSLEEMERRYRPYVQLNMKPKIIDRGVDNHDVLDRLSFEDFAAFLNHIKDASELARRALEANTIKESADLWRGLFGDEFPAAPDSGAKGYTPRSKSSKIEGSRFA